MVKAILTDIEGTTSSLSFVHDVLFPYASEHLPAFVRQHATEPSVAEQLREIRKTVGTDLDTEAIIGQLIQWIDEDKKVRPLKALQGLVWEEGYARGAFRGHVYDDAVRNLRAWHSRGVKLFVFSSGSVRAQKLLFGHTTFGDLTPLFTGYFDTSIGNKRDPSAYTTIAGAIGVDPADILFLSDVVEELDAARNAGMPTVWLVRDAPASAETGHPQAKDFDAISL